MSELHIGVLILSVQTALTASHLQRFHSFNIKNVHMLHHYSGPFHLLLLIVRRNAHSIPSYVVLTAYCAQCTGTL